LSARVFVGRARELERLSSAVERAFAGEGALVCLVGEAGIGKSRLAEHTQALAEARGAMTVSGRCWESGGAPAYWPFVEAFRQLGIDDPLSDADSAEGPGAADARFDVFDRAARRLRALARERPIVMLLDDLHAADSSSLSLLQFLARGVRGSRLCVIATYRETEARLSSDVSAILAKIAREGDVITLARLSRSDVATWLAEVEPEAGPSRAADLHRISEGNPLFVEELMRVGNPYDPERLSLGLEATIDEHLSRLGSDARSLIETAAVIGRELDPGLACRLAGIARDRAEPLWREARTQGVLEVRERERLRFTHVLLRDRLHTCLPAARRADLHWRVGLLLRDEHGDLASAAHHLLEGRAAGELDLALETARDAASQALARLAFEEATRIADGALALLGDAHASRVGVELMLASAEGRVRAGDRHAGLDAAVRAARAAEALGTPELLAQAALVYSAELVSATIDPLMVDLLRRAMAALDVADSPLRARVLARLASALMPPLDEESMVEIQDLATEARVMATRLGDAQTSLYVLSFVAAAIGYVAGGEARKTLINEIMTLAAALNHRVTLVTHGAFYAISLLEQGLRTEADAALANVERVASELANSRYRWRVLGARALLAAFDGDLDEALRLGREVRELSREPGMRSAELAWALQRIGIAYSSGDAVSIRDDAEDVLSVVGRVPQLSPYKGWVLAVMGRHEEATRALNPVAGNTNSYPWLLIAADACTLLGNRELGAPIYEKLLEERFKNRVFWGPAALSLIGPTSLVLADLARVLGRETEALALYDEAIELSERIGARPLARLSRTRKELMVGPAPPPRARAPERAPLTVRLEGDVWAVESAGRVVRVKDGKGMRFLAELVEQPRRELFVLDLIGADEAPTSTGPALDAQAKQAYRARVEELRDVLVEAERNADVVRAEKAREELDRIAGELAGAVGLGGRDRKQGSNVERARINVQRRLKDAIARIAELDPELGRILSLAVKTGTYCSFTPL